MQLVSSAEGERIAQKDTQKSHISTNNFKLNNRHSLILKMSLSHLIAENFWGGGGLSYTLLCDFCYLTVSSYLFTLEANTNSSSCHTQSSLSLICHVLPPNSYSEPKFSPPDPMSVFPVQTFWRGIRMTVIKISFTLGCKEVKSLCPGLIAKKRRTGLWMQICLSLTPKVFLLHHGNSQWVLKVAVWLLSLG